MTIQTKQKQTTKQKTKSSMADLNLRPSIEVVSGNASNPFNSISETINDIKNCKQSIQDLHKEGKKLVKNNGTYEALLMSILFTDLKESKTGIADITDYAIRLKNTEGYSKGTVEFKMLDTLRQQVSNVYKKMAKNEDSPITKEDQKSLVNVGSKLTGENCIPKFKLTYEPLTEAEKVQKEKAEKEAEESKKAEEYRDHKKWFMGLSRKDLDQLLKEREERFGKTGEAVQPAK
jgi:hypothetical protein